MSKNIPIWFLLPIIYFGIFTSSNVFSATEATLTAVDKSIRLRNYKEAVELLKPMLKLNHTAAQFRMAGLYRSGKGVKQNLPKAIDMYEKAAIGGLADAQFALASLLEKKHKETELVKHWYQAAAKQGHKLAIRKLATLKKNSKSNKQSVIDNKTIFDAIQHNNIEQVKSMHKSGIDLNIYDEQKRSTLLLALVAGHEDMASLLLKKTQLFNSVDKNLNRPIHIATRQGFRGIVEKLISAGADINARDKLGNSALMIAVRHDNHQMVELLLVHDANPKLRNQKQYSAIDLANNLDAKNTLELFNRFGIVTKQTSTNTIADLPAFEKTVRKSTSLYSGWPLLNIASHLGEKQIVQQLFEKKANVNARDKQGNSALHRAAESGRLAIVKALIAKGSQVNARNQKRETPLYLAASSGQLKTLQFLLSKGAKSTILATNKLSPLAIAIVNKHEKSAAILLKQPLTKMGIHHALTLAVQNRLQNIAIQLVKQDKLLDKTDQKKRSLLWHSVDLSLNDLTATLLSRVKSIPLDLADVNGYTALARAVQHGNLPITRSMVKLGANLLTITREKNTLIMLSVLSGNRKMTEYLLKTNIDLNARNNTGETAIMLAATAGANDIVELLINSGADLQLRNQDDLNAYQIALNSGHDQTAALIKTHSGALFKLFN